MIDAAIVDGVSSMLALFSGQQPKGSLPFHPGSNVLGGDAPFYRCYRCADGRFIAVGAIEEKFWTALLAGVGMTPAAFGPRHDPASWPAQCRQLEAIFAGRTAAQWEAHYAGTDACVTALVALDEAPAHPQVAARDTYRDGAVAPAPRLSRTPAAPRPSDEDGRATLDRWLSAR
jgi:alpha-methylacyl-CoA racemase